MTQLNNNMAQAHLGDYLRALWPAKQVVDTRERIRAAVGGVIGMLLACVAVQTLLGYGMEHSLSALQLAMIAPIGASAVMVFAAPTSPMSQPWSVIGGLTVSALVGIACARFLPDPGAAAAVSVGLSIALMFALRCMHPPGGCAALLMVLTHNTSFGAVLNPVLLDAIVLVAIATGYNNLTGVIYPFFQKAVPPVMQQVAAPLAKDDLDSALTHFNQTLDVNRDDLEDLVKFAESAAYQRTIGQLRVSAAMQPMPLTVRADTPLREIWSMMRAHRIKALPVLDSERRVIGIVTVADFWRQVDLSVHEGVAYRLRALVRNGRAAREKALRTVDQIMTREVITARDDALLVELVDRFTEGGHRHLPVVDAEHRLLGMVTQPDLIRELYRAIPGKPNNAFGTPEGRPRTWKKATLSSPGLPEPTLNAAAGPLPATPYAEVVEGEGAQAV